MLNCKRLGKGLVCSSFIPDIGIQIFTLRCWWFLFRSRGWICLDTRMFCHNIQGEEYHTQSPALLSGRACSHEKSTIPSWYIKKCYLLLVSYSQNLWNDMWFWNCKCASLSVVCVVCLFILKTKKIKSWMKARKIGEVI